VAAAAATAPLPLPLPRPHEVLQEHSHAYVVWLDGAVRTQAVYQLVISALPLITQAARDDSNGMEVEVRGAKVKEMSLRGLHARQTPRPDSQVQKVVVFGRRGGVAFDTRGPGAHFCSWAQRCHKSNFSYYFADFSHGVFYQKCWDPDCVSAHAPHAWSPQRLLPREFARPELFEPPLFETPATEPPAPPEMLVDTGGEAEGEGGGAEATGAA